MNYKIEKYDMIVKNVVEFEMRGNGNIFVGPDGEDWINIYYALYKESEQDPTLKDIAWSKYIDIPFDIYLLDRKFKRNEQTQEDVDTLNGFFAAIGSPEIRVKLDQSDPIPPEEETPSDPQ